MTRHRRMEEKRARRRKRRAGNVGRMRRAIQYADLQRVGADEKWPRLLTGEIGRHRATSSYTHGRLVGRFMRLKAKLERHGTDHYRRRVLETVRDLIVEERRLADPLAKRSEPTADEVKARLRLMTRGGGIHIERKEAR